MKKNAETINVLPFDPEKLTKHLSNFLTLQPDESILDVKDAIYDDGIILDRDACYGFLDKRFIEGKPQIVIDIPVKISTKTENGRTIPTSPNYYFSITIDKAKELCSPAIPLKEYMASRFGYNPRIIANTLELIAVINDFDAEKNLLKN